MVRTSASLEKIRIRVWGGSYHYEVRVPELLCDSSDAKTLNAEIMDIYGEEAKREPGSDTIKYSMGWESHWEGSLLSLELTASQPDGEVYHDIYYFDFETQTRLTAEDVLTRMGLSWQTLEPALIRTAAREHDRMMQPTNSVEPPYQYMMIDGCKVKVNYLPKPSTPSTGKVLDRIHEILLASRLKK